MILLFNKRQFGHSSEKTPKNQVLDNQFELNSFNEVEILYDPKVIELPLVDLIASKKLNTIAIRKQLIKQLPVIEVECVLQGKVKNCSWCKADMIPI